jgi:trimeric autotransporter adhesin
MSSAAKNIQCENLTVTDGAQAGLVLTCVSAQGKVAWAAGGGGGGGSQQGFRAKDGSVVITDNAAASVGGDVTGNLMGDNACAGGPDSAPQGDGAVSIGWQSLAEDDSCVAIGQDAKCVKDFASVGGVAIGLGAEVHNAGSVAIGRGAQSLHQGSYENVVVGAFASIPAGVSESVALGRLAAANGSTSVAVGVSSISQARGVSVGPSAVSQVDAVAIGSSSGATTGGVAIGRSTDAGDNGVAIGFNASGSGMPGAVAIGNGITALEADSFNATHRALTTLGVSPMVSGNASVFDGNELIATPLTMNTDGDISNVVTINSLPYPPPSSTANGYEITNTIQGDIHTDSSGVAFASGVNSIAIGANPAFPATASGQASVAIGTAVFGSITAAGDASIAIGLDATAIYDAAVSIGRGVAAMASDSFNVIHRNMVTGGSPVQKGVFAAFSFAGNELQGTPIVIDSDGNITNVATINGAVIPQPGNQARGYAVTRFIVGDVNSDPSLNASATGFPSAAFGFATASGNLSLAVGASGTTTTVASGDRSAAVGFATTSSGVSSIAVGDGAASSGASSTAVGESAAASGDSSVALGHNAQSLHTSSVCLGNGTTSAVSGSFNTIHRAPASPTETGNLAVFTGREIFEVAEIQADTSGRLIADNITVGNTLTVALDGGGGIITPSINLLRYEPVAPPFIQSVQTINSSSGAWTTIQPQVNMDAYSLVTYFPATDPRKRVIDITYLTSNNSFGSLPASSVGDITVDVSLYTGGSLVPVTSYIGSTFTCAEDGVYLLSVVVASGTELNFQFTNTNAFDSTVTLTGQRGTPSVVGSPIFSMASVRITTGP